MELPERKQALNNINGFPGKIKAPEILKLSGTMINTMYSPPEITDDWEQYSDHLKKIKPDFSPKVVFMGHKMSEIENMTLMVLGGIIRDMNGTPHYILTGSDDMNTVNDFLEEKQPNWFGISLYTGLTDFVFNWLKKYKIEAAKRITGKNIITLENANKELRGLVSENNGPVMEGDKVIYAPIIIGGHYNNYDYNHSWEMGADYVVRGRGINLLRDIILGIYKPGIYHDPMPYANLPRMDREGFYRDNPRYAKSKVKSIVTALGCNYACTYCYVSSMVDNLKKSYEGSGKLPPSIIQDRKMETVIREGMDILMLDKKYGVKTTTVFDQADISLNNINWWEKFRDRWIEKVNIPFYIQARPAMLAGKKGRERINIIATKNLVSGISMAIESGDEKVRSLLLNRHENNKSIIDAIKNVKEKNIALRTQCIVALPTIKPKNKPDTKIGLIDRDGNEHYYTEPLEESLKALTLVCESNFSKEDYYWNALYSPFPGTPLGNYTIESGFADDNTDGRAYQFIYQSNLNCFDEITTNRQLAFSQTSNFFAHLNNGHEMMKKFLYSNEVFNIENYATFIETNSHEFNIKSGQIGKIFKMYSESDLIDFIKHAYNNTRCLQLHMKMIPYYMVMYDGLILAAKVADKFNDDLPDMADLYRIERNHYYDNNYKMHSIPERYAEYFMTKL